MWCWLIIALPIALTGAGGPTPAAPGKSRTEAKPQAQGAADQKPRSAGDPSVVKPAFAWPDGMSASVEYRSSRTQDGKPGPAASTLARLGVRHDGGHILVRFRDWKPKGAAAPPGGIEGAALAAAELLTTVVDQGGALVRLDGQAEAAALVAKLLAGAPGPTAPKPNLTKMLPALITKEARETWEVMVAFWREAELEVGAEYETEGPTPVAVLPDMTLRIRATFGVDRWLDCPGRRGSRCVAIHLRSEPNRDDLAKVTRALLDKFGVEGAATGTPMPDLGAVTEIDLVTEPAGLRPHRLTIRRTISTRPDAGTNPGAPARIDTKQWNFRYDEP